MHRIVPNGDGNAKLVTTQIFVAAMVLGIIAMYFVLYVKPIQIDADPDMAHALNVVGYAFTAMSLCATFVIHFVVPARGVRMIIQRVRAATRNPNTNEETMSREITERLATLHRLRLIMCGVMLEGTAFLLGVAYHLNRTPMLLATGVFVTLILASMFPTRDRFDRWIERQERIVRDETFAR